MRWLEAQGEGILPFLWLASFLVLMVLYLQCSSSGCGGGGDAAVHDWRLTDGPGQSCVDVCHPMHAIGTATSREMLMDALQAVGFTSDCSHYSETHFAIGYPSFSYLQAWVPARSYEPRYSTCNWLSPQNVESWDKFYAPDDPITTLVCKCGSS